MIGALWTGISGLAGQQTALDNESHNIANVNTVGYKSSRISFANQMYQNKIGKGTQVLDAEKLYTQGNLKITGVSYDMALSGDGFFAVSDTSGGGTSETYYTRAGNFRMGDSGELQDSIGNAVQGWAMASEPTVETSNPNINVFTNDYTKLLSSKIVQYSNAVETITAKATDFTLTAASDSADVFSGAGLKTKSGKISDVEELINSYTSALQALKTDPNSSSASSRNQVSHIDLPNNGTSDAVSQDGDEVYVYIDGDKISQSFISGTDTADGYIKTMKAFADKISEIPGIKAFVAENVSPYTANTADAQVELGTIRIESLIPGEPFTVSSTGMVHSGNDKPGTQAIDIASVAGSGVGALESARDALNMAISGKQTDVFTPNDLIDITDQFQYSITIYDKGLNETIQIPNIAATGVVDPMVIPASATRTIDELVALINNEDTNTVANATAESNTLTKYIKAENINGNLIIKTLDSNFDVEYSSSLTRPDATAEYANAEAAATPALAAAAITAGNTSAAAKAAADAEAALGTATAASVAAAANSLFPATVKRNADYSGREGASGEFMEIKTRIDQTSSKGNMQLRLDSLNISDSAFGDFSVDSSGLITMSQDGAEFAVGQVAIAKFITNRGLEPMGNNLLSATLASGDPIYNLNNDKTAEIQSNTLELSTADLSESLVNLMVFQRAFEANAKSITTADTILNTLIQLKR